MSTIKANTLLHSDGSTTTQPSIPALDTRMAKAWCNLNMPSNAIRSSFGISSVTDIGAGQFRFTLSTACTGGTGSANGDHSFVPFSTSSGNTTTQSPQLRPSKHDSTRIDPTYVYYMAMGGQA